MDWMHERFAELSTELTDTLDDWKEPRETGSGPLPFERGKLARLWRANMDVRNFVVLGDPAVRLSVFFEDRRKGVPDLASRHGYEP
ncbi:MAG: hypothetical protein GY953_36210, partial [bacterium]|nr:hypothetical protein [bacterium]